MLPQYSEWIKIYLIKNRPTGQCAQATLEMQKQFPELIRVRGHYYEPLWGTNRQHWWLKTSDGKIVDPTASQFPTNGTMEYSEWQEGAEEPVGKCLNCGELVFLSTGAGHNACSLPCHKILVKQYC